MPLPLPSDYAEAASRNDVSASEFRDALYSTKYLEMLRDGLVVFSMPGSLSRMMGFHTSIGPREDPPDFFFFVQPAYFKPLTRKFHIGCVLKEAMPPEMPSLSALPSYKYDTGPRQVLEQAVTVEPNVRIPARPRSFAILVRRAGGSDMWHGLMEIMSLTLTMDVLRITRDPATGEAFFSDADVVRTQVIILDDRDAGALFDLWRMVAGKPTMRLKDLSLMGDRVDNLVVPLPGASNPLWTGRFETYAAEDSALLRVFARRVFRHAGVGMNIPRKPHVVNVTFARRHVRRIADEEALLNALREQSGPLRVQLRNVDFTNLPLANQIAVARATDVLVGVHSTCLTQAIFMREGSAVVEIRPPGDNYHHGYRHLAVAMGHSFFSAAADGTAAPVTPPVPESQEPAHGLDHLSKDDLVISKQRFIDLITTAVKSMYHKGERSFDAV